MVYYYHPHTGRFERNTRSTVRASTVGPTSRRGLDDDLYFPKKTSSFLSKYDSTSNEYQTSADINRNLILSSAAMEDNYDISARSRQRDRDVMAAINRAVSPVDSESPVVRNSRIGTGRRSAYRGAQKRSQSIPAKRPTYTTTELVLPLDLKASAPPKPSAYFSRYKSLRNKLPSSQPQNGEYTQPLYSRTVRTSFTPSRESPFRNTSPFRASSSLRSSPFRSPSPSLDGSGSLVKKRFKPPRVIASKRRVGNYYSRLLAKKGGKAGKYWPYIDVEDIENENLSDFLSDTEAMPNADTDRYGYQVKLGNLSDYDTCENLPADAIKYSTYSYDLEDEDIPDEYVPFLPRARCVSPERDYSQLSVIPYLPSRDPGISSVEDEISFNAVVAQSAARARRALENVNWDAYESAGLVLSVEGEYKPPEEEAVPLAFRYISRPIMLKVPAAQKVSYKDSENSFTRYMNDLRKFRDGVRLRLEEGYRTLCRDTKTYSSTPAITSYESSHTPYVSKYRPTHSYRRYLADDEDNKYGHSLELYPASSAPSYRSRTPFTSLYSSTASARAITDTDSDIPHTKTGAIRIYDSNVDSDKKLGTLARVEIKVNTEVHTSPRSAVAARRVAARGQSMPPPSQNVTQSEVHVAIARARHNPLRYSVPPASVPSSRAWYPRVTVVPRFRNFATVRSTRNVQPTRGLESSDFEGQRRAPLSLITYLRNLNMALRTKRYKPRSTRPYRPASRKAALLASKVESMLPARRHGPRSKYAQEKMRSLRKEKRESVEPVAATVTFEESSKLKASPPIYVASNVKKPMWDSEGQLKKPNIMSWQYRLDTCVSPDDLIILPRSLNSVRERLRGCQDKLDRHRQLMDRYLVTDKGLTAEEQQVLMRIKCKAPPKDPALLNEDTRASNRARRKLLKKYEAEY